MNQLNDIKLLDQEQINERKSDSGFFQVDFLKAVMIFLVIFDHIVHWDIKRNIGVTLWERISIPVFLVILGFNMGRSFQQKGDLSLKELYSWSYFKHKILRYIVPFLVLYAASTFNGIMHLFIGFLPFWGPGNWFLPLLFQSILILPLLYKLFTKKPILALILCFIMEFALQLTLFFFIGNVTTYEEGYIVTMFMTSVLFYLPAIGLGMWFSFGFKLESNRNFFMWFLYSISLAFCVVHQFFGYRIIVDGTPLLRGDYHLLIVPYSAFLFLLAMKFLPQKSNKRISRGISLISKSTYHILLTQILGYGMMYAFWGTHYAINTLVTLPFTINDAFVIINDVVNLVGAWLLFISFGIIWYKIDQNKNLLRRVLYYFNFFIVFSSVLFFNFWLQVPGFTIPISVIIIIIYAVVSLIVYIIYRKQFKTRPLKSRVLGIWTLFLLVTFGMMGLELFVFLPNQYWISWIFIGPVLICAIIVTIFDYILKK
jgi:hypothetical protein